MNTETTQTTRANLTHLAAIVAGVALHASTDQNRATLCAIYITPETIQATNSYTLAIYRPAEPITTGEPTLINARELLTALNNLNKAASKQYQATEAALTITGTTWQLTATADETTIGSYNGHTTPGEYPNTTQLFANLETGKPYEPTGLNPDHLETITKTSRKISKHAPLIMATWQTPTRPIIFTTTNDLGTLTQLLMPQRIND